MGNEQCCSQNLNYELDNNEELYIREEINNLSNKIKNFKTIRELSYEIFGTSLIDIDNEPLEWITPELYEKFLKKIFENKCQYKTICLNYNDVNISSISYKEKFNLIILIWLLGIMKNNKMSLDEKINTVKEIIIKNNDYITFNTFSQFIKTFLEIMLIEITFNFKSFNEKEVNALITKIYNLKNMEEYHKWLINKMRKIVSLDNNNLREEESMKNEYITNEQLNKFFNENSFLFSPIDLRQNFYQKYNNQINDNFLIYK